MVPNTRTAKLITSNLTKWKSRFTRNVDDRTTSSHLFNSSDLFSATTGSGRNTLRFGNTVVSGIFGVGNLSLSALLARLKAFQLPWSAGLYSIGLSLWRRISKTTILSLWLSGYFVGTSIFIGTTVSIVAILYCCGWETAEKQRLPQKRKRPGREPSLKTPENIERLRQAFVRGPPLAGNVLTTRDATSQTLYSGSEYCN